jgi:hypothetical protein
MNATVMSHSDQTSEAVITDVFSSKLRRMPDVARPELDRHLPDGGDCVICHSAWPCARAERAAFMLEAV